MAFTHYYELYKRVPRRRRRELASFIHDLKCLCGRKYHLAVGEMLEDCDEDYVYVECENLSVETAESLVDDITKLCEKYSIPTNNMTDIYDTIEISLYTDF